MVYKKGQMGNMLHLVIIAVVILIAAMAIILMVTNTTGDIDKTSGDSIDKTTDGIIDALDSIGECPGSDIACEGHSHKVVGTTDITGALTGETSLDKGAAYCCTSNTIVSKKIQGSCELVLTCNP
ncbi:MAG: hypothetical protein KAR87_05930 [Candidatus Aenigmarchaeota archaeon]|nr:hypothetical protein [Candidatus Aenigmarchaeota archaeon]